jgi:hypothetical protein
VTSRWRLVVAALAVLLVGWGVVQVVLWRPPSVDGAEGRQQRAAVLELASAASDDGYDEQAGLLADGVLTDAELIGAYEQLASCWEDLGGVIEQAPQLVIGPDGQRSVSLRSAPGDAVTKDDVGRWDACIDEHVSYVSRLEEY